MNGDLFPPQNRRPRLLDLFSGAGGAGEGYRRAGFDVVGVDIERHDYPPGAFVLDDALAFAAQYGNEFDVIHASPPCQAYTNAQRLRGYDHPDLIAETRDCLRVIGKPYVIENVPGSPLHDPIELCGVMFPELAVYRHRLFESNVPLIAPLHSDHVAPIRKMGRKPAPGEYMHVVGNFSGVQQAREAMGIPWMTRDDLREAIPPAYTEWIGAQLIDHLAAVAA